MLKAKRRLNYSLMPISGVGEHSHFRGRSKTTYDVLQKHKRFLLLFGIMSAVRHRHCPRERFRLRRKIHTIRKLRAQNSHDLVRKVLREA